MLSTSKTCTFFGVWSFTLVLLEPNGKLLSIDLSEFFSELSLGPLENLDLLELMFELLNFLATKESLGATSPLFLSITLHIFSNLASKLGSNHI